MIGMILGQAERKGTTPFSTTSYWNNSISYPKYVYDSNSLIYNHIENYKINLEKLGIKIEEARLIKQEEQQKLGCNSQNYNCSDSPYSWIYSTSYWTGTALAENVILFIYHGGVKDDDTFDDPNGCGIRPVIKIPLTEF